MADLKTTYMGIELKNPIILGACNLVSKPEIIQKLEEAGIAAFVYKSLFEEQINLESIQLEEELTEYSYRSSEAPNVFPYLKHAGPEEHLLDLKKFKKSVSVPVFASLNAINDEVWTEYAKKLQDTGVDGLELNLYWVPDNFSSNAADIENKQIEIVNKVKNVISIPVAVKLSPFYTNTLNVIKRMSEAGADGVVIFNRFFQPEINTGDEEFYYPFDLSKEKDYQLTIRYTGMLFGNIKSSICGSRAIFETHQMLKVLLAGADAVQIVSAVYKSGHNHIDLMLYELKSWMERKGYNTIDDFKGKLSRLKIEDPFMYNRAHYVDILSKSEEIYKRHLMV
ncbi:MAG: dihydroorotate dehydrogenase-like protein [Bacteroidota bacterium]|nr:dihydroorotate dehydrogenase-like protein [Bacteroidota bacterium]MDP4205125.1 dihydroorotate dehydrogenase-like protein [Bacteroidota bacterium]